MIYFDNASTTKYKPASVYEAANFYLREIGVSPGRGSYGLGIEASRMLYKSRCSVGKYFGRLFLLRIRQRQLTFSLMDFFIRVIM